MGDASGLINSWTSGEICEAAWDRTDIQPVEKGCQLGLNLLPSIQGPLVKRAGWWDNGAVLDQTKMGRLIPFRRSVNDALALEFGDGEARVWSPDGSPLLNAGAQVTFATPFSAAQIASLRYKQVGDVIYFMSSLGLQPQTLSRVSNTSWSWAALGFPNGPWLPAGDPGPGMFVTATAGGAAGEPYIPAGATVNLQMQTPVNVFQPGHVGSYFRILYPSGSVGIPSWAPKLSVTAGTVLLSAGRVYVAQSNGTTGTTPPVHEYGSVSDGGVGWTFVSDGAGIVQITAVSSPQTATGVLTAGVPFVSGALTDTWQEGAYSNYRGWPTAWPAMREERLALAATDDNDDTVDLTETSGFTPTTANFHPNLGTGQVIDTDAIRLRLGDDGAQVIWLAVSTYLTAGTDTAIYLIAGSVLDEPLSPSAVQEKKLSTFGSADVPPVQAWDGILYVTTTGQTLREIVVDTQQNRETQDLSFLATHITSRGMGRLAWTADPNYTLWMMMADAGLAAFVYHQEQQVKGFTRQQVGAGDWVIEDCISLPGPGLIDTPWLIVSRVKAGVTQRHILMLSRASDGLFMDVAQLYQGAPVTTVSGLDHLDGEIARVLADGAQYDLPVTAGAVTLPVAASRILVGLPIGVRFVSLRLDQPQPGASLNTKQRPVSATVSLTTAGATLGVLTQALAERAPLVGELVSTRTAADVPAAVARRVQRNVTLQGSTDYDPRLVIVEDSAYPFSLNSIRLRGVANA